MKKTVLILFVGLSGFSYSQVGINTTTPQATLEVTGFPADPLKLDGVIAPKLTGNQLAAKTYTAMQTGAIVYATAAADSLTGQVVNVLSAGYYYFDGSVWQNMAGLHPDVKFIGTNNHISQDAGVGGTGISAGTGGHNVMIGLQSGNSLTIGSDNIGIGRFALQNNQIGSNNTGVGTQALRNNTATSNTAFGAVALTNNTSGTRNVAVGERTLTGNTTGNDNTAVGSSSLRGNTTGTGNVAIGRNALDVNIDGVQNTSMGNFSLTNNISGQNNVALGYNALRNSTENNNTAIGHSAGSGLSAGSNNILIGSNVQSLTVTGSNQLNIGNWIYGDNGNIAIGNVNPTEKLDVTAGNVRIRDINTNVGTDTDKVVVADANGVLKTVPKQTALLVGGDLSDALPTTTTITSSGGTLATAILDTYTFVITQKSLVTFSYDVSYTIDISTVNNGNSRFIGTYFQFTNKPAASTLALNSPFANVRTPFSTGTGGVPGFYSNSSSSRLVLEPGSYTITLSGNFYSNGTVNFGGSTDHVTIVADPNF